MLQAIHIVNVFPLVDYKKYFFMNAIIEKYGKGVRGNMSAMCTRIICSKPFLRIFNSVFCVSFNRMHFFVSPSLSTNAITLTMANKTEVFPMTLTDILPFTLKQKGFLLKRDFQTCLLHLIIAHKSTQLSTAGLGIFPLKNCRDLFSCSGCVEFTRLADYEWHIYIIISRYLKAQYTLRLVVNYRDVDPYSKQSLS